METVAQVRAEKYETELRAEHQARKAAAYELKKVREFITFHTDRIDEHTEAIKDAMSQGYYSMAANYADRIKAEIKTLEGLKDKEIKYIVLTS